LQPGQSSLAAASVIFFKLRRELRSEQYLMKILAMSLNSQRAMSLLYIFVLAWSEQGAAAERTRKPKT
jgi:hypothetical protein